MSGIRDVGARDILKKFDHPDGSTIVEGAVKVGGRVVASEYLTKNLRRLSCCRIRRKEKLVDDLLNYLQFHYIDSYILHILNVHAHIILNDSSVLYV